MKTIKKTTGILVMAMMMGIAVGSAQATVISFSVTDLTDTVAGQDLWQYSYNVSDASFTMDTGFTIYFDPGLYGTLDPMPSAPNADWDVMTWDPDPGILQEGAYDAYALVNNASLADPFTVSFVWQGNGRPGAQAFEIYDAMTWTVVEKGNTIPEPGTLFLFALSLVVLWVSKRFTAQGV